MRPQDIVAFDESRDFSQKAFRSLCYAPHTNLFFDTQGRARACCWNWEHPLGNVQTHTLDEIWRSAQANILRQALENYSLHNGCALCEKETENGWTSRALIRNYDTFSVEPMSMQWPKRMEFAISNVCNLECVMCTGEFSSAIRTRRERRPPLPKVYTEAFLQSLRKYVPHLEAINFLGGEPFLISEYYTIWQILVEEAPHVKCHVLTNGTQYNDRIEHFMQSLDFSFAVSLDGATKATVESIRVNANFDEQMNNLQRLREYTRKRNTDLFLTFCFMRKNWHEFGEFCLFADSWDCDVKVNHVTRPPEMSIETLPSQELCKLVDAMGAQAVHLDGSLKRNREAWFTEYERWRKKCGSPEPTFTIL
jgi:MoaA/NifB/PqqE/SkfB family radical SAM enzyme